jgi:hypothetical protein
MVNVTQIPIIPHISLCIRGRSAAQRAASWGYKTILSVCRDVSLLEEKGDMATLRVWKVFTLLVEDSGNGYNDVT